MPITPVDYTLCIKAAEAIKYLMTRRPVTRVSIDDLRRRIKQPTYTFGTKTILNLVGCWCDEVGIDNLALLIQLDGGGVLKWVVERQCSEYVQPFTDDDAQERREILSQLLEKGLLDSIELPTAGEIMNAWNRYS